MDLIDPKGEHYNLRWNNYSNNLIQVFSEHQHQEILVDAILICEGQYVRAHKLILSACSGFFQEMFRNYGHISNPFILLNGIKLKHLRHIIEFIYHGEIKVLDTDLEGVLALGEHFQVKGLCSVKVKQSTYPNESNSVPTSGKQTTSMNEVPVQKSICSSETVNNDNSPNRAIKESKIIVKSVSKGQLPSCTSSYQNSFGNDIKNKCTQPTDSDQPMKKKKKTENSVQEEQSPEKKNSPENKLLEKRDGEFKKIILKSKDVTEKDSQTHCSTSVPGQQPSSSPVQQQSVDQKTEQIPRPVNAFMIFANEWRKKLSVEHPGDNSKSISVRLGNLWKSLSAETRESYYSAARQAQLEHQLKYPGYYMHISSPTNVKVASRRQTVDPADYTVFKDRESDDDLQIIENRVEDASCVGNKTHSRTT